MLCQVGYVTEHLHVAQTRIGSLQLIHVAAHDTKLGIDMWQDNQGEFTVFYQNPTERSIRGTIVRSIAADGDGNIWFCT